MNLVWKTDSKKREIKWSSGKDNIYCETCNIAIAFIMLPEAYLEPYQRSKMECFARIVYAEKLKTLHLRYLTGFWIRFSMVKSILLHLFFYTSNPRTMTQKKEGAWWPSTKLFLLRQVCIAAKKPIWKLAKASMAGLFAEIVNIQNCFGTNIKIQNLSFVYLHKSAILTDCVFKNNNNQFPGWKLLPSGI